MAKHIVFSVGVAIALSAGAVVATEQQTSPHGTAGSFDVKDGDQKHQENQTLNHVPRIFSCSAALIIKGVTGSSDARSVSYVESVDQRPGIWRM